MFLIHFDYDCMSLGLIYDWSPDSCHVRDMLWGGWSIDSRNLSFHFSLLELSLEAMIILQSWYPNGGWGAVGSAYPLDVASFQFIKVRFGSRFPQYSNQFVRFIFAISRCSIQDRSFQFSSWSLVNCSVIFSVLKSSWSE